MSTNTHRCPRPGCGAQIPWMHYACRGDWFALPANLRIDINAAWQERMIAVGQSPLERGIVIRAHLDAMAAAVTWFRANPKSAP